MNKAVRQQSYWGTKTELSSLLEHVRKIGPILEENAEENDKLGRLNEVTFAALKPLRMSHIFAGEEIGGAQLSPTQGLELLEAITYHSGAAGWISMVHACIGAMSAAFLPDSAIARLFAPDSENRFSGQGTPTGHAEEGRRRLSSQRQDGRTRAASTTPPSRTRPRFSTTAAATRPRMNKAT